MWNALHEMDSNERCTVWTRFSLVTHLNGPNGARAQHVFGYKERRNFRKINVFDTKLA